MVTRRGVASIVPVVVLGTVVSLGVVAVSASRFGWRRSKAEKKAADGEEGVEETVSAPAEEPAPEPPVRRFKPAPPRDPDAPRWDTPPAALASAADTDATEVRGGKTAAVTVSNPEASDGSNATAGPAARSAGEAVTATESTAAPEPKAKPSRKPPRRSGARVRPEARGP